MRAIFYLAIPAAMTALNLLFASVVVTVFHPRARGVAAQQPGHFGDIKIVHRPTEPEPYLKLKEEANKALEDDSDEFCKEFVEDEKDPMLRAMPIDQPPYYKDVYVKADISSFYREEPGSRVEVKPKFNGQACRFTNLSPYRTKLYWESDVGKAHFIGNVGPWEAGGTACFPNHKFYFQRHDTKEIVCRWLSKPGTLAYYFDPFVEKGDDEQFVAMQGDYAEGVQMSLSSLKPKDLQQYKAHRFNLKFAAEYKNFTGGSEWLAMYPKDPPSHPMWRADYFGQTHTVTSRETHFQEIPPDANGELGDKYAVKRNSTSSIAYPDYRLPGEMNITIKAVSCAPRAFQLDNFLSEVEVDHVLDIVTGRYQLKRSTTGSLSGEREESEMSDTRTSKNTWVPRTASPILDAIYRRVADALRLDEALLRKRSPSEPNPRPHINFGDEEWRSLEPINEQIQLVHYKDGAEYTAHHDFGYSDIASRSINLCIYLNEGMTGGETKFPRARSAESDDGIPMVPQKGKAMIFYMVNPDGNLDDLTQHAAMPVTQGEKWFANLWIWDPFRE